MPRGWIDSKLSSAFPLTVLDTTVITQPAYSPLTATKMAKTGPIHFCLLLLLVQVRPLGIWIEIWWQPGGLSFHKIRDVSVLERKQIREINSKRPGFRFAFWVSSLWPKISSLPRLAKKLRVVCQVINEMPGVIAHPTASCFEVMQIFGRDKVEIKSKIENESKCGCKKFWSSKNSSGYFLCKFFVFH